MFKWVEGSLLEEMEDTYPKLENTEKDKKSNAKTKLIFICLLCYGCADVYTIHVEDPVK